MNIEDVRISLARDFSRFPAGRYLADGPFSGQEFREKHLVPALKKLGRAGRLVVDLDGVEGTGSSFLDEAFGGLVRDEGMEKSFLNERLEIRATEPDLLDFMRLAERYIENADSAGS